MVSSWFPSDIQYYSYRHPERRTKGLLHRLVAEKFATAAFLPFEISDVDAGYHAAEGFQEQYFASMDAERLKFDANMNDWNAKAKLDELTLDVMRERITKWNQANQRYAAMFLPQIGHAPWPNVKDDGVEYPSLTRGRNVMALQDQWLGKLLQTLEENGRLDKTLIVVTGDHGIRTFNEDNDITIGVVDPYSFEVPLLVFAPPALDHMQEVDYKTSHIDLAPTLLDLLGLWSDREYELGAPIWDERLRDRTTMLWGDPYFSFDGFTAGGRYYMWNKLSGLVCDEAAFDFTKFRPATDEAVRQHVMDEIMATRAIQYRLSRSVGTK